MELMQLKPRAARSFAEGGANAPWLFAAVNARLPESGAGFLA